MLEAIHNTYDHFKLGKVENITEDYVVTEKGIWCHVLSQKRILQIQAQEGVSVNYLPNPCLFVKSSIAKSKPPLCLLLHNKNALLSAELLAICGFLAQKGLKVNRIDDMDLEPRERLRAFKEAAFVIAWDCNSWLAQLSLCATGTPFLLAEKNVSKMVQSFVTVSNITEALFPKGANKEESLVRVEELYMNSKVFKQLTKDTLREMKNLYTWRGHLYEYPRGNGTQGSAGFPFSFDQHCPHAALAEHSYGAGIFCAFHVQEIFLQKKQAILFPWICYLTEKTLSVVDSDAFKVSLITCLGVLTENKEVADKIQKLLSPIPVSVLPMPKLNFDLAAWRKARAARVLCRDGVSICSNLNTLKSRVIDAENPLGEEIVVSEDALWWHEIKANIRNGIPFVCPRHEELPGKALNYPGFCNAKLDPKTVAKFLTLERVENMLQFIEKMQVEFFREELKETTVYANCMQIRS